MSLRQILFAALVVALAVTLIDALAPSLAAGFAGAALAALMRQRYGTDGKEES